MIGWTLSSKKLYLTRVVDPKYLIGGTPSSPPNLITRDRNTAITWLVELPARKNLIGRERNTGIMWFAELPAPRNLIAWTLSPLKPDWMNSLPPATDRLNSQPRRTWLALLPAPPTLMWRGWNTEITWLAKCPAPWNLIGRELHSETFHWSWMFFWPLTLTLKYIQTHFISHDPPYSRGNNEQ